MMRRLGLAAAVLVVAAASIFWLSGRETDQTTTLCVPRWHEELLTAEILAARDRGMLEALSLELEVVDLSRGDIPEGLPGLVAEGERCQLAVSTTESVVKGDAPLGKIVPLYFYMYGSTYDTNLVVSKRSNIKSVADLLGKRVRLGQPATHYAMENLLKKHDLELRDLQLIKSTSTEVLAMLDAGEIDAAVTYFPTMPVMIASGRVDVLVPNLFTNHLSPYVPHSVLLANADFVRDHRPWIDRFTETLEQTDTLIRDDPALLARALINNGEELGMKPWSVDPVTLEKSSDLFGDLRLSRIDDRLPLPNAERTMSVLDAVALYRDKLVDRGFTDRAVDLTPWASPSPR